MRREVVRTRERRIACVDLFAHVQQWRWRRWRLQCFRHNGDQRLSLSTRIPLPHSHTRTHHFAVHVSFFSIRSDSFLDDTHTHSKRFLFYQTRQRIDYPHTRRFRFSFRDCWCSLRPPSFCRVGAHSRLLPRFLVLLSPVPWCHVDVTHSLAAVKFNV